MKFGSLFSGIGGMDLGLERAGMICKWQVEIDDYCQRVLNKHWPDVPKSGEVRDVGKGNLETVDLIAGGFPCQPHSVAGKRKGAEDDRNLWPEFIRIIREIKPKYVLAENVPGIITTYIDTVLSDLEGQGYACSTFNIPACALDAPHRRERIFVVAYCNGSGFGWSNKENEKHRSELQNRRNALNELGAQSPDSRRFMADSNGTWTSQSKRGEQKERGRSINSGENVADTESRTSGHDGNDERTSNREINSSANASSSGREQSWWSVEPNVGRVAHGIPSRVDRLRGLGNSVVPQVAEWIGERIIEFERNRNANQFRFGAYPLT